MAPLNMNEIPAMLPPSGRVSNFDSPETMHPIVLYVAVATMALMALAVAIRIFTKGFIMKDMRVEECRFSVPVERSTWLDPD